LSVAGGGEWPGLPAWVQDSTAIRTKISTNGILKFQLRMPPAVAFAPIARNNTFFWSEICKMKIGKLAQFFVSNWQMLRGRPITRHKATLGPYKEHPIFPEGISVSILLGASNPLFSLPFLFNSRGSMEIGLGGEGNSVEVGKRAGRKPMCHGPAKTVAMRTSFFKPENFLSSNLFFNIFVVFTPSTRESLSFFPLCWH